MVIRCAVAWIVGAAVAGIGHPALAQQSGGTGEPLALFDAVFYGRGANSLEAGDPASAQVATRVLSEDLGAVPRFHLVDSAQLAAALRSQEANGLECNTMACRQAVAARVGARWMVTSKVSKTSNLIWYVSGQLTEVPTGRRLLDDEFELKGKPNEIIPQGAQSLARRIVRAAERAERGLAVARVRGAVAPYVAAEADRVLRVHLGDENNIDLLPEAKFPASAPSLEASCNVACLETEARSAGARWVLVPLLRQVGPGRWTLEADAWSVTDGAKAQHEAISLDGTTPEKLDRAATALARSFATLAPSVALSHQIRAAVDTPPGAMTMAELRHRVEASTPSQPADLSDADLRGLDLNGFDFRQAILTRADLRGGKLAGANLFACDLTDAKLAGADAPKANLDGSTLRRADLRHANLEGASLFATIIEAAQLDSANLSGARIIGYLRKARLRGTRLTGANIGADPGNQSMGVMRAQFGGADLTGADLSNANLFKADFSYATLHRVSLTGADLRNSELIGADLTGANVTDAKFDLADVSGTVFKDVIGRERMQGLGTARNRDKAVW